MADSAPPPVLGPPPGASPESKRGTAGTEGRVFALVAPGSSARGGGTSSPSSPGRGGRGGVGRCGVVVRRPPPPSGNGVDREEARRDGRVYHPRAPRGRPRPRAPDGEHVLRSGGRGPGRRGRPEGRGRPRSPPPPPFGSWARGGQERRND
ncbi:hypothetical protein THAOC_19088, partial [Thalassiosira oceanica]